MAKHKYKIPLRVLNDISQVGAEKSVEQVKHTISLYSLFCSPNIQPTRKKVRFIM